MTILFLSHDGICNGGAQLCLLDLIRGIKHQEPAAHLYIVAPKNGSLIERCAPYIDGYRIIPMKWWMFRRRRWPWVKRLKTTMGFRTPCNKLRDYLQQIKPDWAVTNTIVVPQLAMAAHRLGIPHLWFIHEIPMLSWKEQQFIYPNQKLMDTIGLLSTKMLVTSEYVRRYYATQFGCRHLETIDQAVAVGADAEHVRQADKRYTVVAVGSFEPNKGQLELLAAIQQITARGGDLFCYFVGGEQRRRL